MFLWVKVAAANAITQGQNTALVGTAVAVAGTADSARSAIKRSSRTSTTPSEGAG